MTKKKRTESNKDLPVISNSPQNEKEGTKLGFLLITQYEMDGIKLGLIFFAISFPLACGNVIASGFAKQYILRKYYTEAQIKTDNLHFVDTRNRLLVSNNHELPEKEHELLVTLNNLGSLIGMIVAIIIYIIIDKYILGYRVHKILIDLYDRYSR